LNNQLTDFDFKPADSGGKTPNQMEANKRPRSSMAPTIVLSNTEPMKVVSVIGSPGGAQIPAFIASRLMANWWGNTPPADAVAAGHVVLRENRLDLERGAHTADFAEKLKGSLPAGDATDNLTVNVLAQTSGVHWIQRTPEGWLGVADPRREGSVLSDRSAQ
jgi:gamma-glutamyltranspeptidase/glutathione hydrolase